MKKTLTVNLGGTVFNIDEDAYQLLDKYLTNLRIHFQKEEGSEEIMNDFEMRISELFSERIRLGYEVITIEHVEEVIKRMGKPEDIFEGEEGKGSGRSIPGFDLHEALSNCREHIEKFGGHSMAIGITVKKSEFESFKSDLEEYATNKNVTEIVPVMNIDKEITLKQINIPDVQSLQLLEPFGEANTMPIFLLKNLKINSIRALSEGKHLKLTLKDGNYMLDAIGFNMGELSQEYKLDDKIDIIGTLGINTFKGMQNVQLTIKDMRRSY